MTLCLSGRRYHIIDLFVGVIETVVQDLHFRSILNASDDLHSVDRFGDEVLGPSIDALDSVFFRRKCSKHDHWNAPEPLVSLDPPADFKPNRSSAS